MKAAVGRSVKLTFLASCDSKRAPLAMREMIRNICGCRGCIWVALSCCFCGLFSWARAGRASAIAIKIIVKYKQNFMEGASIHVIGKGPKKLLILNPLDFGGAFGVTRRASEGAKNTII